VIKKTITYTDYNDESITEDFYFNISKAEFLEMELLAGEKGLGHLLSEAYNKQDRAGLLAIFKEIILKGIGVRSEDGKYFRKPKEHAENFEASEAYSELFIEIFQSEDSMIQFIAGVLPSGLVNMTSEELAEAIKSDMAGEKSASDIIREKSEAQMQGHNKTAEELAK
jgi:hypothetical protein